jgi:uncharacterized protein (TIGR02246 family)
MVRTRPLLQLRDFAEPYTAAWCSQDAASVAVFFSSAGSLTINGGVSAVGRDAIREVVLGFMTAFPDLVLTMKEMRAADDRVAYHWTFAGMTVLPARSTRVAPAGGVAAP